MDTFRLIMAVVAESLAIRRSSRDHLTSLSGNLSSCLLGAFRIGPI